MTRTRDLVGYGGKPPHADWPGGSRIAVQFVVNYEEGAERSIEFGDDTSETLNSDNVGAPGLAGQRDFVTESHYDYGARAGYWRLMDIFDRRGVPVTVFAVGQAVEKNEAVRAHLAQSPHEVCCHGWRWIDYRNVPEDVEREHMNRAFQYLRDATGKTVSGWYTGRISGRTRSLAAAHDGFLYDSDAYDDDLPYWVMEHGKPWLVIPYSFDCNDMRFASAPGFNTPDQFFAHLKQTFDVLYAEGEHAPKMMSIGLHCRLAGRPARAGAVASFVDYVMSHENVWVCRRDEIARHWHERHYGQPGGATAAQVR